MATDDIRAARLARKWDWVPQDWSDSKTIDAMGETVWFSLMKFKLAWVDVFRPLTRPVRRTLLRAFA